MLKIELSKNNTFLHKMMVNFNMFYVNMKHEDGLS
jgi:hypothetical protein